MATSLSQMITSFDDFSKLGISEEATYIRLVELEYLKESDYNEQKWKSKFANSGYVPTADMSDGGGAGTADPLRDKQTQ